MARFSEQFIQQVAQSIDIVDLISQYVALKKRGKEFVGLCPFHEDHKPSMYVSPAKQIFKCFACGAGGGVFQFMMLYEKLSFPETVELLANRANIPLPKESSYQEPVSPGLSKNDLVRVTTFAARFYRDRLNSDVGAAAMNYARKRGLTDESIKKFGIGFAPDSWDSLFTAARSKGFSESQLVAAGLVSRRENASGCYDRFRNRLIFPILDPAGLVIAFGGRAMDDKDPAKYLNSPESTLFDKSAQLYALNWSREGIVSTGRAIVVEGYLDALIPIQAGVGNVVATLGTALTDRHVRLLSRYANEAVLVFDADAAGVAAAERAMEIFLAQRLHVRVATIPTGKDPCDYCLAEGGEALKRLVDEAPDALQYIWQRRRDAFEEAGGNLADRRQLVEDFLRLVVASSSFDAIDDIRRGQLAQHIGHMLNVPPMELQQQMRRLARQVARAAQRPAVVPAGQTNGGVPAERHLLEVLLNRPDLFDAAAEQVDPADFDDPQMRVLAESIWRLGQDGRFTLDSLMASAELADSGSLIAEMVTTGQRRENYERTLAGAVENIVYRRNRRNLQSIKSSGYSDDVLRNLSETLKNPDMRRHPKIS